MRLSAAQLELQSAKAAAANALKQHMTRLQEKLQDRCRLLLSQNSITLKQDSSAAASSAER
jgi:hypothetical protein